MMTWVDELCRSLVPFILTYIKPFIITFLSSGAIGGIAEGYVLSKKYNHNLKTAKIVTARPMVKIENNVEEVEQESVPQFEDVPPESLLFDEETKKSIVENQLSDTIKEFVTTIEEKNNNLNLFFMYDNLRSLKVNRDIDFITKFLKGWNGVYLTGTNEIKLSENSKITFFHELFHMATAFKRYGVDYCGFSQYGGENNLIGTGINEGYTNLLVEHYFGLKPKSYKYEMRIARQIENIIGREKMEQLYFKADLQGLIGELSKYCSLDESLNLVQTVDYINYVNSHHRWGMLPVKKAYLDKSIALADGIISDMTSTKNQAENQYNQKIS